MALRKNKHTILPGNRSIKVEVTFNGNMLYTRIATLVSRKRNGNCTYTLDDGTKLLHNEKVGYHKLADRILTHWKG